MSLQFRFGALQQEIEMFKALAARFLDSTYQLDGLRDQLKILQTKDKGTSQVWAIAKDAPLRTIPSRGKYQKGKTHGKTVVGVLSSIWEIGSHPKTPGIFELVGNASTSISIEEVKTGTVFERWNFDIGVVSSPGCHFHAQRGGKNPIDVPRIPVPFVLQLDALDFLLGELFQDEWPQKSIDRASPGQRERFEDMIAWMTKAIEGHKAPWLMLKAAKPGPGVFLR